MKIFELHFFGGKVENIEAISIEDALIKTGHEAGGLDDLEFYRTSPLTLTPA